MALLFTLVYTLTIVIGYLLMTYYYKQINLSFTAPDFIMLLVPAINIGVVIAILYCILTKRHYEIV